VTLFTNKTLMPPYPTNNKPIIIPFIQLLLSSGANRSNCNWHFFPIGTL